MRWFLLAPGPSMSLCLAERVRGGSVCVVNNAYELAPWADVLVANDIAWWRNHPEARQFSGRRFSANRIEGVEQVKPTTFGSQSNSGTLALDVLRNLGAAEIILLGVDMHGSHFFGAYANGCGNTTDRRRRVHHQQFRKWQKQNSVSVINCTEGSSLKCFPMASLDAVLASP